LLVGENADYALAA